MIRRIFVFAMLLGCLFKSSGIDYDTLSNDLVEWKKDCYAQSNQNPISSQINFYTVKFEKILSNGPEIASFLMQKFKDGNGELIVFFPRLFKVTFDSYFDGQKKIWIFPDYPKYVYYPTGFHPHKQKENDDSIWCYWWNNGRKLTIKLFEKKYKEFHCSRGFISDFKYHHGFSSKVFHLKRRSDPNNDIQRKFLDEMKHIFKTVDLELIINCDETGWKLFPKGILTWGETGVDNVARLSTINDKSQVTVLASITAAGTKLPLLFVAQGKTSQVESTQIGDVDYHWKCHSESGWMTDEVFKFYLMKLREHLGHDKTIHLVMDLYPAHMTSDVDKLAEELNFKLHIIPAGMTDVYQPLDRRVFGPLKAKARKFFRQRNHLGQPLKATKSDAFQDMCRAWESVTSFLVLSAWSIYVEDEDESPEKKENEALRAHHRDYVKQIREESIRKRIETRRCSLEDEGYKPLEL